VSLQISQPWRSFSRVAAIACPLCLLFLLGFTVSSQNNDSKHVLILMEEDVSWPAFRLINENAVAMLREGLPPGSLVFTEHLDRVHFPDPLFQTQEAARIQRKYAESKIDLVTGVGDVPTDLFPGVPLLYVRTDRSQERPYQPALSSNTVNLWIAVNEPKTLFLHAPTASETVRG
jgi:hypothetical protein